LHTVHYGQTGGNNLFYIIQCTMGTYFFGRNILFLSFLENPKKSLKIKAKPTKPWGKFTDPFDLVYQRKISQKHILKQISKALFGSSLIYIWRNFLTGGVCFKLINGVPQIYLSPKLLREKWVLDKPIRKIILYQLNIECQHCLND